MEWMGCIAFIMAISYCGYPGRVNNLEGKIKRLERKQRGNHEMSKLINELIGKTCKIQTNEDSALDIDEIPCTVLDTDDEWMKITYTDEKNGQKTAVLRIDSIEKVELINE